MPVYLYRCPEGDETELQRPVERRDWPVRCDECDAWMRRVFTPAAVVLKGPGFYKTDNRKMKRERTQVKVGGS